MAAVDREPRSRRQQQAARAHVHHERGAQRRIELDPQRDAAVHRGTRHSGSWSRERRRRARRDPRAAACERCAMTASKSARSAAATACSNSGVPRSCAGRAATRRRTRSPSARIQPTRSPPHTVLPSDPIRTTLAGSPSAKPGRHRAPIDVEVGGRLVEHEDRPGPLPRAQTAPRARSAVIERPVGFWKSGIRYAIDRQRPRERLLGAVEVPAVSVGTGTPTRRAPARRSASAACG